MRKVQNGRCIANISKKSILANKKRNSILLAAIILTTVMLSTLSVSYTHLTLPTN